MRAMRHYRADISSRDQPNERENYDVNRRKPKGFCGDYYAIDSYWASSLDDNIRLVTTSPTSTVTKRDSSSNAMVRFMVPTNNGITISDAMLT